MDMFISKSPSGALPLYTEAVHRQGSSWGLPSLLLTTKGSWMHLGGFAKPLISPLTPFSRDGQTDILLKW